MTGAGALVGVLEQAGVTTAFGVVSIHNAPIFDALGRSSIRIVPARSEPGAVNMADAHARVSGGVGVAITSTGTGAGNAAGALVEALAASSRVIHLTGQVETTHLGKGRGYIHETPAQLQMLAAVSKAATTAARGRVAQAVADGVQRCVEFPQGPVSIEIPIDLQQADAEAVELRRTEPARCEPEPEVVQDCADLLRRALRPLVWAGGGVIASEAGDSLRRLAEKIGAGIVTSNSGRGSVSEQHSLCIGNFGQAAALSGLWARADLLLSVGTRFRSNETRNYRLRVPDLHIQVDCVPEAIGRSLPASHGLVGDARLVLDRLAGAIGSGSEKDGDWPSAVAEVAAAARRDLRSGLGPYEEILDALIRSRHPDDVFVRDVTIANSLWGNRLYPIERPHTNVFPVGGGIGQGLAMAVGAKLAAGERRVLAIAGDGGLSVNLGEMLTAVQEDAPLTLLVFDDGGYGVLRNLQDARYSGRRTGVDLVGPNFVELAAAMGWRARSAGSVSEFAAALDWALSCQDGGQPAMVLIDMCSIGPLPRPFLPPD